MMQLCNYDTFSSIVLSSNYNYIQLLYFLSSSYKPQGQA